MTNYKNQDLGCPEGCDLSERQKQIIGKLQGDLPLSSLEPYREIAAELGISCQELIDELKAMQETGMLRRMSAILGHHRAGYESNVMIAWLVPEERVEEVGETMATFEAASHVYERPTKPDWPYNLYTMVHGNTREQCEQIARNMSKETGITTYTMLYSVKEFKKTSMIYFNSS